MNSIPVSTENNQLVKRDFEDSLKNFLSSVESIARKQFEYNLNTNVPQKILKVSECAENALQNAIVSAINTKSEWDCNVAIEYAARILEDCNCHEEAKMMFDCLK